MCHGHAFVSNQFMGKLRKVYMILEMFVDRYLGVSKLQNSLRTSQIKT